MDLDKYTEIDFIREPLVSSEGGLAEILISESLVSPYTNNADLSSSHYSWPYIESMSADKWNRESLGNIGPGHITGVKVMFVDTAGENNRRSFQLCNSLALTLDAGTVSQTLILDIEERQFYKGFVYFKVKDYPLRATMNAAFTFRKDENDNFDGYDCSGSSDAITFVVEPYFSAEENSIFNPLYNNVVKGVKSSVAKIVESNKTYASLWGASRTFDGEYADTSASSGPNGAAASWSSSDPENIVDGGSTATYPMPVLVQFAEIPDYFYTALANISGRFLGSKSGYEVRTRRMVTPVVRSEDSESSILGTETLKEFISNYTGNCTVGETPTATRKLTKDTLTLVATHTSSVAYNISDRESYDHRDLVFVEGSGTVDALLSGIFISESSFTGSLNGEPFSGSLTGSISGEFSGSFTGTFSGWVQGNLTGSWESGSGILGQETIQRYTSELGVDPAFYTAREFLGSVYSIDADNIPEITDMQFDTIKFVPRTTYEVRTVQIGNVTESCARTYNRNNNSVDFHAATLPVVGDVIYSEDLGQRLSNSKIFIQETGQVMLTDRFASVVSMSTVSSNS